MKKIFLISFFLVNTMSANEDVWKPTSDYFIDCSYSYETLEGSLYEVDLYAHYDEDKDTKLITDLSHNTSKGYFASIIYNTNRDESTDSKHIFYRTKRTMKVEGGEVKVKQYYGRDYTHTLDRENLKMSNNGAMRNCSILTGEEYRIAINNLEKKEDSLIQDLINKTKSKLKL